MNAFDGRTVVLGVGGGIAAYKACEVARLVVKGGGKVRVAMTLAATRFVGPLTFQGLTGEPVLVDLLDAAEDRAYGHLALARSADLLLVAPATADLIARLRAGMGDDAVTTTALAATCPVLLAPAMNTRMWQNPAVQENLQALRARGFAVVKIPPYGGGWRSGARHGEQQRRVSGSERLIPVGTSEAQTLEAAPAHNRRTKKTGGNTPLCALVRRKVEKVVSPRNVADPHVGNRAQPDDLLVGAQLSEQATGTRRQELLDQSLPTARDRGSVELACARDAETLR